MISTIPSTTNSICKSVIDLPVDRQPKQLPLQPLQPLQPQPIPLLNSITTTTTYTTVKFNYHYHNHHCSIQLPPPLLNSIIIVLPYIIPRPPYPYHTIIPLPNTIVVYHIPIQHYLSEFVHFIPCIFFIAFYYQFIPISPIDVDLSDYFFIINSMAQNEDEKELDETEEEHYVWTLLNKLRGECISEIRYCLYSMFIPRFKFQHFPIFRNLCINKMCKDMCSRIDTVYFVYIPSIF